METELAFMKERLGELQSELFEVKEKHKVDVAKLQGRTTSFEDSMNI